MLCQYGLHLLRQRIHLIVRLGTQQIKEHRRHTRQQVVIALVLLRIDDGILERWLLRIVDSFLYLLVVATDAFHEGLLEVLQTDAIKGHHIMRRPVRFKKRINIFTHTNAFSFIACKITKSRAKNKIN